MGRIPPRAVAVLIAAVFCARGAAAQANRTPAPDQAAVAKPAAKPAIAPGLWEGSISLRQGGGASGVLSSGIRIRILAAEAGALLDIPEQSMFGYPLDEVSWTEGRLRFSLDALGPAEELSFDGFFVSSA